MSKPNDADLELRTFQRTTRVWAWRVTETNGIDVATWCRGGWFPVQRYVELDNGETDVWYDDESPSQADVGEWVVELTTPGGDPRGRFVVMKHEDLLREYEDVTETEMLPTENGEK